MTDAAAELITEPWQQLHAANDAHGIRRARAAFHGSDVEFQTLVEDYDGLSPRLRAKLVAYYGLSGDDTEAARGAGLALTQSDGTGQFLRHLLLSLRPERVLVIDGSYGTSTLHLADAMRQLGRGRVIVAGAGPAQSAKLRERLRREGLTAQVDLREGDLSDILPTVDGTFGMVFVHARAGTCLRVFKAIERLLQPGSVVIADNMYVAESEVRPYKAYLDASPRYSSTTMDFGAGVEFTVATG